MVRKRVYYRGRVQGVGFRYTTVRTAAGFAVSGYVRNLPDGRVEAVAEGAEREITAFLTAVEREMGGYIRESKIMHEPYANEFDGFTVRY